MMLRLASCCSSRCDRQPVCVYFWQLKTSASFCDCPSFCWSHHDLNLASPGAGLLSMVFQNSYRTAVLYTPVQYVFACSLEVYSLRCPGD